MKPHSQYVLLATLASLGLGACGDNADTAADPVDQAAVIGTRAADYTSGAHSVLGVELPISASNELDAAGTSDIAVSGAQAHFYRLQRFGTNTISRYEASTPDQATWTYSTESEGDTNSNPYSLIELNESKAYLLRYGSGKLWIVNPSASSEAEFKIGEIDLSAYDADGVPEMATAVLQGGLLYVGMQRLENFAASQDSYVAIIDTSTDSEIDTRALDSTAMHKGINLGLRNLHELDVVSDTGDLIALATGGYDENFAPLFNGGIARIDVVSYEITSLVDDGESGNAAYGQFTQLAVADSERAYFIGSPSFGSASLYRFNPISGEVDATPVANQAELNLGDIAIDSQNRLWLAQLDPSAPGISILDANDSLVVPLLDTVQVPTAIAFVQ